MMECCLVFDLAQQLKWPFSTISHCSDLSSRDPLPQEQMRPELFICSVTGFIENKSFRWNEKVSLPGSTYKDIFLITWSVLSIRAGSRPKQPATGQSLVGYFLFTLLLILVTNLKWGKDPTKIIVRHQPQMSESKYKSRISRVLNMFTFLMRDGSWSKGSGMPVTFSENRIQQETGLK